MSIKFIKKYVPIIALVTGYLLVAVKMPIYNFDEVLWVGRSFYFQLWVDRDWDNKLWQSDLSYTQPKLGEFWYGLWNYPNYLLTKIIDKKVHYDYAKYLIDNGIYEVDGGELYVEYLSRSGINRSDNFYYEILSRKEMAEKYGDFADRMSVLIIFSRLSNVLLLLATVWLVFEIFRGFYSKTWVILGVFWYSTNTFLVKSSLKAHSEGLYNFLFILCIWLLIKFIKENNWRYLVSFGVTAGLLMATKLNGLVVLLVYYVVSVFCEEKIYMLKFIRNWIMVPILMFGIFVWLNPYTYKNPIPRTIFLFQFRDYTAKFQAAYNPQDNLPNIVSRIKVIYTKFYGKEYGYYNFSYLIPLNKLWVGGIWLIFFVAGIISEGNRVIRGDKMRSIIPLIVLVNIILMLFYLRLGAERYFISLVFGFCYFQLAGMSTLTKTLTKYF